MHVQLATIPTLSFQGMEILQTTVVLLVEEASMGLLKKQTMSWKDATTAQVVPIPIEKSSRMPTVA